MYEISAARTITLVLVGAALLSSCAHSTARSGKTTLVPSRFAAIYLIPSGGGKALRLPAAGDMPFDAEHPAWSPAGDRIAFSGIGCVGCDSAIYVLNLRSRRVRRLVAGADPSWSRAGWIAFTRRAPDGARSIYLIRPGGQALHTLLRPSHSGKPTNDGHAAWSFDGRAIAFTRVVGDPATGNPRVFLAGVRGAAPRPLTADPSAVQDGVAWSPDGRSIAVSNLGPAARWQIYLLRTDGTLERKLADAAGSAFSPAWSPDGSRLAFSADTGRNTPFRALFVVRSDGTELRRQTGGQVEDTAPAWSPGGREIAFSRRRFVAVKG